MSLCACRGRFANGKEMARRRSVSREPQAMLACESLIQRRAASRDSDEAIHKTHRQACKRINQWFLTAKENCYFGFLATDGLGISLIHLFKSSGAIPMFSCAHGAHFTERFRFSRISSTDQSECFDKM